MIIVCQLEAGPSPTHTQRNVSVEGVRLGVWAMGALGTYRHWAVRPGRSILLQMFFWALTLVYLPHLPMPWPQQTRYLHLANSSRQVNSHPISLTGTNGRWFQVRRQAKNVHISKSYLSTHFYDLVHRCAGFFLIPSFRMMREELWVTKASHLCGLWIPEVPLGWGQVGYQWRNLHALTICTWKKIGSHFMRPHAEWKRR